MGYAHYSSDPASPVYFHGGWLSSFASYEFHSKPMFPFDEPVGRTTWATREHWYAAHKTMDYDELLHIVAADKPSTAKQIGRRVQLRAGWDDGLSFAVMVEGIRRQVALYPDLEKKLLETGDRLIAEDSPTDFIWGIRDGDGGFTGRNLLGKAWMVVRAELAP